MASIWMEVFRTGTHTSMNGCTKTYTQTDLIEIANKYNGQEGHEAPLVLGHPATDGPAFGWAKTLKVAGDKLLAFVDQITDSVVDAVKAGHYKKISIALYADGLLRHIGLLGAATPAVKGLVPVTFSDVAFDEYTWATDEWRMPTVGRILGSIRDFFIEKHGIEATDKIIDKDDIARLQGSADSTWIPENKDSDFADLNKEEEIMIQALTNKVKELEDSFAAQSAKFTEVQTTLTTLAADNVKIAGMITTQFAESQAKVKLSALETAKVGFQAFCETLAKEGKILPAEVEGIVEEYTDLVKLEGDLTFAEGIVKPSDKMKTRLEKREAMFKANGVVFANKKAAKEGDQIAVPDKFAAIAHLVDEASVELDRQIKEFAERNKLDYEAAAAYFAKA